MPADIIRFDERAGRQWANKLNIIDTSRSLHDDDAQQRSITLGPDFCHPGTEMLQVHHQWPCQNYRGGWVTEPISSSLIDMENCGHMVPATDHNPSRLPAICCPVLRPWSALEQRQTAYNSANKVAPDTGSWHSESSSERRHTTHSPTSMQPTSMHKVHQGRARSSQTRTRAGMGKLMHSERSADKGLQSSGKPRAL